MEIVNRNFRMKLRKNIRKIIENTENFNVNGKQLKESDKIKKWLLNNTNLFKMLAYQIESNIWEKNNEKMKLQRSISFIKSKETIILNLSTNIRKIAKKILPINRNAIRHFVRFFAFIT